MEERLRKRLAALARRFETADFLRGDPSFFMHGAHGPADAEATAFTASTLAFGSRKAFMPKIAEIVRLAGGDVDSWLRHRAFEKDFPAGSDECFYRFYTRGSMNAFFARYADILESHGTLGQLVERECGGNARMAVETICRNFRGAGGLVPQDAKSACKRVCMFLRWMVRDGSPVDLGLWSGFIDRATLPVPLDTHVIRQARLLGLLPERGSVSMSAAVKLSGSLAEAFPGDPCRGDFALFGLGASGGGTEG